jgi:DNA-binding MarR family transcriptional regulator
LVGVAARSLAPVEGNITLQQYRALVVLSQRRDLNAGALAEALGIRPSTATGLCDRLEGKGLIDRVTSAASRREVTVRLTPDGRKLLHGVMARRRREVERILGKLEPAAVRRIADAFDEFAAAARELPDEAWKLGWT